jgi:hypothetical protein
MPLENFGNYIWICRQIFGSKLILPILNSKIIHITQVYSLNGFILLNRFILCESTLTTEQLVLLMELKSYGFGLVLTENMRKSYKDYNLFLKKLEKPYSYRYSNRTTDIFKTRNFSLTLAQTLQFVDNFLRMYNLE